MSIEIVPTVAAFGAEIRGVNLAQPIDDETFAAIERAYQKASALMEIAPRFAPRADWQSAGRCRAPRIEPQTIARSPPRCRASRALHRQQSPCWCR